VAVLGYFMSGFGAFAAGDGSGTNNQNLLRGTFGTDCTEPLICGSYFTDGEYGEQASNQSQSDQLELMPEVGIVPLGNVLPTYSANVLPPATQVDWSVSLRGAYQKDTDGERFEVLVAPNVAISHRASAAEYSASLGAEIVRQNDNIYRLTNGALDFDAQYAVDNVTGARLSANLTIDQASPKDPGLASNVATAPIVGSGSAQIAILRRFGMLDVELRGNAEREIYSTTGLKNGTWQDNSERNRTGLGFGLQTIHELTGFVDGFADISAARDIYDRDSIGLGTSQNSWTLSARAGLRGNWSEVVEAEISVGYGLRKFDSALLSDVPMALADASFTYRPDETLELVAQFGTNITSPDPVTSASTMIEYEASGSARYVINEWLATRANISGRWARFAGSAQTEQEYSAGVGADYEMNAHTKFTTDYSYGISEITPNPVEHSHRVEVGVTYSR